MKKINLYLAKAFKTNEIFLIQTKNPNFKEKVQNTKKVERINLHNYIYFLSNLFNNYLLSVHYKL